jgi:TolB-like protein
MLAAGRKPFTGETPTDVLASILTVEPPPISEFNRDAPDELQEIVAKMLRKSRDERYQNAKALLEDLRTLKQEIEFQEKLRRNFSSPKSADAAPASNAASPAAKAADSYATQRIQTTGAKQFVNIKNEAAPNGENIFAELKRHKAAAFASLLFVISAISVLAYFFLAQNDNAPIRSLAVLPFVNASGDRKTEFLSDGITETLINDFTKIPTVRVIARVIARSTAFRYKGKEIDPRIIGKELGVRAILTGKVLQRGDALQIQVDLIDARDGAQLWGEQYKRKLSEMMDVQQTIAREISERLRWRLTGEQAQMMMKSYTANAEAYQIYLKGRYHWNKRTAGDFKQAIDYFKQAIGVDPNYALAYSGLSDSYALLPLYDYVPPREYIAPAKKAALRAVALDDNLAEAHVSLANVLNSYEYNWADAEREFKRAIELNPNYSTAHQWYAEHLSAQGRSDEALAEIRRALELDPLSLIINTTYGGLLEDARRYDEGIAQLKKTIQMDANFSAAHCILASVYDAKAMYAEGVAEYAQCMRLEGKTDYAERIKERFARGGYQTYLRESVEELRQAAKNSFVPPFVFAEYYSMLGDKDEAFKRLENAYQERDPKLIELKTNPYLDNLRADPRFQELLKRVGLSR